MIDAATYRIIACMLEQADVMHQSAHDALTGMQNHLTAIAATDQRKSRLRQEIETTRADIAQDRANGDLWIIDAVKALQVHVAKYYGPINSFLSANSIKVPQYFADVSQLAGYTISHSNIDATCEYDSF